MRNQYGPYSGVCYDGPLEGERHTVQRGYFLVPVCLESVFDPPPPDSQVMSEIKYDSYRWSRPLRKWVYET